jgi:predicted DNA-binding transcriptional regulator AlpA
VFTFNKCLEEYKDLLSTKDLAVIFGVSEQTIYKEIKQGKFGKPFQIGRAFKIPKVYIIEKYIANYQ